MITELDHDVNERWKRLKWSYVVHCLRRFTWTETCMERLLGREVEASFLAEQFPVNATSQNIDQNNRLLFSLHWCWLRFIPDIKETNRKELL